MPSTRPATSIRFEHTDCLDIEDFDQLRPRIDYPAGFQMEMGGGTADWRVGAGDHARGTVSVHSGSGYFYCEG